MPLVDVLFGKPLATYEDTEQRLGPPAGIGVFGLDALSSAAYGPEAALTLPIPFGAAGLQYVLPINFSIIALPSGGGSYTVARENLGMRAALVSAAPSLQRHTPGICLGILAAVTLVNLRGVRETGNLFMAPTYLFIGCLPGATGLGHPAWFTVLLIPSLPAVMIVVHRHYLQVAGEIELVAGEIELVAGEIELVAGEIELDAPLDLTHKGLRFAIYWSTEVHVLEVRIGERTPDRCESRDRLVERPVLEPGLAAPKLTVVDSPYRRLFNPILDFVSEMERKYPDRYLSVVIPELVETHGYHDFVHNQRANILKAPWLVKGNRRINV